MPPYEMLTKDHMKAVLAGKKELLKMSNVNFCNSPNYDETGVKSVYDRVVQMPGMSKYFPDKYPKGR